MIRDLFPFAESLLLDANMFVVQVVGECGLPLSGHKPVGDYNRSDFELLSRTIREFDRSITTPFIVSEVSGLLNTTGSARVACRTLLSKLVPEYVEQYDPSKSLAAHKDIAKYGFADISIERAAKDTGALVLSADGPLVQMLRSQGITSLHYKEWKDIANGWSG